MKFCEECTSFSCQGDRLFGILARPEVPASVGVVVIVGGPQYRAGSHRQFVMLSRVLAANGFAVLRFDYRGMGDSNGSLRNFEDVSGDVGAAIDAFQIEVPSVKKIALWGLCDAASAALLYLDETSDPRIRGLCLLNPWVRSEASLAKTRVKHYYIRRLRQKEFWRKLLGGQVALTALKGLVLNIKLTILASAVKPIETQRPFQDRMAGAWKKFDGRVLLLLSGDDYTAKEFVEFTSSNPVWIGAFAKETLVQHSVAGADHTFSEIRFNSVAEKHTLDFLSDLAIH